jgi:hypothetical protein
MLIFIPFLAWFTQKYSDICYKILVSDKLETVEKIIDSGEVPRGWRFRALAKIAAAQDSGAGKFFERALKKRYTRKLRSLIRYVKGSSVLSGNSKTSCLEELYGVLETWEKAETIGEIIGAN